MTTAPALAALLAMSCGRSLTLDDRPGSSADGSSMSSHDGGDAASVGGASGAAGVTGSGGSTGAGGRQMPPIDAGNDRTPDAPADVIDARVPDVAPDHTSSPDLGGGCPADCTTLPHVRANAYAPCLNGACDFAYGACEAGWGHCSNTPNVGCETDLSSSPNCGGCNVPCTGGSECRGAGANYYCLFPCQQPTPDVCNIFSCVDLQTDQGNCGTCGNSCYVANTQVACQQGQCVILGCTDPTFADCTSDPGCETPLGSDPNCGGCNDPACTLANTMFTCSDGLGCHASVCNIGFANCNTTSPDCETSFAMPPSSASCLPQYLGTLGLATQVQSNTVTAIASDGSFFLAGVYMGTVDFDPSQAGKDIRTAADSDGYVTKFNADGSYAWTAALAGRGAVNLTALAVTPSGGVVASGSYQDTIDLDPSPAQDVHVTNDSSENDVFVVELAANATEVWGRTFPGSNFSGQANSSSVAVDAAGAVYIAGYFSGTVDFDPGPGDDTHTTASSPNGFLVKLTSGGDRAWSRILDDANCESILSAVTIATDGSIWSTGAVTPEASCTLSPQGSQAGGVLILKVDPANQVRTTWALDDTFPAGGVALAAGPNGAVYVGGTAMGDLDLDPGPGVARRWLGTPYNQSGFVLKLAADGTYQWSRVLNGAAMEGMAVAPGGGVVAIASNGIVTRLTANGDSVWTFAVGDGLPSLTGIASSGTSFAFSGNSSGTEDFDPSPGVDLLFGDIAFVSRFTF